MTAGGVMSVARWLFLYIDYAIYWTIEKVGEIFSLLSRGTIFAQEDLNNITNRVYLLVALIMLFRLAFAFVNYIINPEQLTDSKKGGGQLLLKVVMTLALLVLTPTIFNEAYHLQKIIIDNDLIGKLVTGQANGGGEDFSKNLSYKTFRSFFNINPAVYTQHCSGSGNTADSSCIAAIDKLVPEKKLASTLAQADSSQNIELIVKTDFVTDVVVTDQVSNGLGVQVTDYVIDYKFGLSTLTGIVIAWLLISFCFDVAIRMVKLGFLQLIAPIPIVMSLAPGIKKDPLSAWGKECFSTYVSLFLRLMVIYLAYFVIDLMVGTTKHGVIDVVTGNNTIGWQGTFVNLFAIIGALLFAKEAPKLIEQLFGLGGGMKMTFNPIKTIRDNTLLSGMAGGVAGGIAGGLATGIKETGARIAAGEGVLGAARGLTLGTAAGVLSGATHGAFTKDGRAHPFNGAMKGATATAKKVWDYQGTTFAGRTYDRTRQFFGAATTADVYDAQLKEYKTMSDTYGSMRKHAESEVNKDASLRVSYSYTDSAGTTHNVTNANYQHLKNALAHAQASGASAATITDLQASVGAATKQIVGDYIDQVATGARSDNELSGMLQSINNQLGANSNGAFDQVTDPTGRRITNVANVAELDYVVKGGPNNIGSLSTTLKNSKGYAEAQATKKAISKK